MRRIINRLLSAITLSVVVLIAVPFAVPEDANALPADDAASPSSPIPDIRRRLRATDYGTRLAAIRELQLHFEKSNPHQLEAIKAIEAVDQRKFMIEDVEELESDARACEPSGRTSEKRRREDRRRSGLRP